jgi:hypothetical protein
LWLRRRIQIAGVFVPRAGDKQEHKNNHEPLLGRRENKNIEEAFHRAA